MPQKARKSIPPQTINNKPSVVSAVHPCFDCGLIFAKTEDFRQHMDRFHQSKNQDARGGGGRDRFRCHECAQTFANDEKALKEHLLHHDLAKIIAVLKTSETGKKRLAPIVVRTPIIDTTPVVSTFKRESSPPREQEEKSYSTTNDFSSSTSQAAGFGKFRVGRPKNRNVFTTTIGKNSDAIVNASSSSAANPAPTQAPLDPARKRRRITKELPSSSLTTPVQAAADPISTSSPLVLPPPPPVSAPAPTPIPLPPSPSIPPQPIAPAPTSTPMPMPCPPPSIPNSEPAASSVEDKIALTISAVVPPTTATTLYFHPPPQQQHQFPPPPPPPAPIQKGLPPPSNPNLQSLCPNCDQNLGKPWHLVDHMIQRHEAQLIRLHRMLKKPESVGGICTTTSQLFSERHCSFCQLTHADLQSCLMHVVRTHRSRLFECPDNGECVLTCELMCAIGQEAALKKFTINVKVKRKAAGD